MPLLNLPERTITATTAAGPITLTYYYSPATSATKPTLFLLHGFPDTVSTFNSCASHLISHGYGILAPNPLGYGTSDRPVPTSKSDVSTLRKFASKHQGDSFIAIIDKELGEDKKVVVMGHDWGSYLVGKFALLYPERVAGVVLGNIAFFQPTETMDLDMYNKMLLQMSKVEHSGYIKFFAEFEHASDLIKKNVRTPPLHHLPLKPSSPIV